MISSSRVISRSMLTKPSGCWFLSHSSSRLAFGRPRTLSTRLSLSKSSTRRGASGTNARVKPAPVTNTWFDGVAGARSGRRSLRLWRRRRSNSGGGAEQRLLSLPLPGGAVGRGLADRLNDSAGPPLSVLAFAALQVGGNSVVNHPTVHLEQVPVRLGSCGRNSHESQYGRIDPFSQSTRRRGRLLRILRR